MIPIMGLVFDNDGVICGLFLPKCRPQSAHIVYILSICTGFFWGIVEIIQYLRGSLEESIANSKALEQQFNSFFFISSIFSEKENSGNSLEGKIKLYGLTIFFFMAWGFLTYCFYVIQPNIIQAIVGGLMFTWVIGLYPLVRCIMYFNEKLQNWINEE